MDTKTLIDQKNNEIQAALLEYEATRARLEQELLQAATLRDDKVAKAQQARDEAAMKEKLKAFPVELVNNHKTCSVCGGNMRPYQFMEGDKIVKAWACQVGSLQPGHDLIRV